MYLPDLFGAYIRGRELAIDKNWNDLMNYEKVESARNSNDMQALQLLGQRADFGGNRSVFRDNVDASGRSNEVAEYAQPGMVAKADMSSMYAQDQRSAFLHHRPEAQQLLDDRLAANLADMRNEINTQTGRSDYMSEDGRDYEYGRMLGNTAYQNVNANNIAANNLPNMANQQIAMSDANFENNMLGSKLANIQTRNAIDAAPEQARLDALNRQNNLFAGEGFIDREKAARDELITNRKVDAMERFAKYEDEWKKTGSATAKMIADQLDSTWGFRKSMQEATESGESPDASAPADSAKPAAPTKPAKPAAPSAPAKRVQAHEVGDDGMKYRIVPSVGKTSPGGEQYSVFKVPGDPTDGTVMQWKKNGRFDDFRKSLVAIAQTANQKKYGGRIPQEYIDSFIDTFVENMNKNNAGSFGYFFDQNFKDFMTGNA